MLSEKRQRQNFRVSSGWYKMSIAVDHSDKYYEKATEFGQITPWNDFQRPPVSCYTNVKTA